MNREFPPREEYEDGHGKSWDDICECGHSWSEHDITLLALFRNRHGAKKCEICQCPQYKRDKDNPSTRRMSAEKNQ